MPNTLQLATAARLPLALLLTRISMVRAFRRSGLGPLWSTIGVLVTVAAVGLLFGTILRRQLDSFETYVAALASGLVMWTFLAAVANDSSIAFARWMPILRHSRVSFSVIALSILLRHLPVLALNMALLFGLQYLFAGHAPHPWAMPAATLLVIANTAWVGILSLIMGARFRDIGQLVASALQIAFLLTPILWPVYFLGRFEWLLLFNPFYYLLSVFSAAAAGEVAPALHWAVVAAMAAAGGALAFKVYRSSRRRWPYWV